MTFSHGARPPLETTASAAIRAAQSRLEPGRHRAYPPPPPPPKLTAEERAAALEVIHDKDAGCTLCGGIHPGQDRPACPRLASFKVNGDGTVTEGTFWPGTEWAIGRVVLAEDAGEEPEASDGSDS